MNQAKYPATFQTFSRRSLLKGAAGLAAATIVPRHVLGGAAAPSNKIALAAVGVGGVGFGQVQACEKEGFQIVALCDLDDVYAKKAYDRWPQARRYQDFREMVATEGDKIDAVYCGTPDHTHAVITLAALRSKKHVCCVKPLTRTVRECRTVVEAARQAGVATQVTAEPNTSEDACRTCELIWAGAIGDVHEVHIWTNRPLWPQGMMRPEGEDPVPSTFDWDLWLGPSPARPFKDKWPAGHLAWEQITAPARRNRGNQDAGNRARAVYHPWNFRGWWDFGTGSLGDMGCHYINTPYRALKLTWPTRIHATATRVFEESAPLASIVTYDFPARKGFGPVRVIWYDGGLQPPFPREMAGEKTTEDGVLYIGSKGKMLRSKILTPDRAKKFVNLPKKLPRRPGVYGEWMIACQGGEPAGCNFDWAGPLTDFVLLGNIAIRTGATLDWDAASGRFSNHDAANRLLHQEYRTGWKLEA